MVPFGWNRWPQRSRLQRRRLPWSVLLALVLLLTLGAGMSGPIPPGHAQIPLPVSGEKEQEQTPPPAEGSSRPWWHVGRAHECGRFWCSEVVLPYLPLLQDRDRVVLAVKARADQSPQAVRAQVESRAKTVEDSVSGILRQLLRHPERRGVTPAGSAGRKKASPSRSVGRGPLFWWIGTAKPRHPGTPRVEVGIRNAQTVIYVVEEKGRDLAQQTIVTVTEVDALQEGRSVQELAGVWRDTFRRAFSEALWGQEFNRTHPMARPLMVVAIAALVLILLGVGVVSNRRLAHLLGRLRRHLRRLEAQTREEAMDAYRLKHGPHAADSSSEAQPPPSPETPDPPAAGSAGSGGRRRSLFAQLLVDLKDRSLADPHWTRQFVNVLSLLNRLQILGVLALVLTVITTGFLVFPSTRLAALYIALQSLAIPLIWLVVSVAQPLLSLAVDQGLHAWKEEAELTSPASSRYALRVSTYSRVWKGGIAILCIAAGLYGTVAILGIDPSLLAGAGVLAIAAGFLARSLLEDVVNGMMILVTDRFAIGDVIHIDDKGGLVEEINLHVTKLRGSNGQLTTIPNRHIIRVENLTQNWSRVDFTVRIAAAADSRRALAILEEEAERLRRDPEWAELIPQPIDVLGVDEIDHSGSLLRVWIVTQPMKQWLVGREYRLRVQEAFRLQGIPLGVPQRQVALTGSP